MMWFYENVFTVRYSDKICCEIGSGSKKSLYLKSTPFRRKIFDATFIIYIL